MEVYFRDSLLGGEPECGWVVYRSAEELGIKTARPVLGGTRLEVRVVIAPASTPWVLVEVKGISELAGRHVLHCRFAEPPAPEVLALFR